jgi:hypothetical protein
MAVPGGFSTTALDAKYADAPLAYQVDAYLAAVSASTNQRTIVQSHCAAFQGVVEISNLVTILTKNT